MSTPGQLDLIRPREIWKGILTRKIEGLIPYSTWEHLRACGEDEIYQSCVNCGSWKQHTYACNLKFCPRCNWRISREREKLLKLWSYSVKQPKHLVLTQRNFPVLTRTKVRKCMAEFSKMRRTKVLRDNTGGCVSCEVTNEKRGWHLHLHILVDVRWIDPGEIAIQWGKRMGQEAAIVKVKDARDMDYLAEVCKYAVKPAQMVQWPCEEIAQFIHAVTGVRLHATFGNLFVKSREFRAILRQMRPRPEPCKCGCREWHWEDERSALLHQLKRERRR